MSLKSLLAQNQTNTHANTNRPQANWAYQINLHRIAKPLAHEYRSLIKQPHNTLGFAYPYLIYPHSRDFAKHLFPAKGNGSTLQSYHMSQFLQKECLLHMLSHTYTRVQTNVKYFPCCTTSCMGCYTLIFARADQSWISFVEQGSVVEQCALEISELGYRFPLTPLMLNMGHIVKI